MLPAKSAHGYEAVAGDPAAILFIAFPHFLGGGQPCGNFSTGQEAAKGGIGQQRAAIGVHECDADGQIFQQRVQPAAFCIDRRELVADQQLLLPRPDA